MIGITESLFGVQPSPRQDLAEGIALAGKDLTGGQIGGALGYAGMKQLGRGLMAATGTEDPEQAEANKVKAAVAQVQQQGINTQTSQGMKAVAQILNQQGSTALAFKATQVAQLLEEKEASIGLKRAQTTKALREPKDTLNERLLSSGKYTPASIAKYIESDNPADLVLVKGAAGAGDGTVTAGPVGKAGAYRNAYGEIIPGAEMSKQRAGFQAGEKLLENLNVITKQDIKDAESIVDWTTGENKKQLGGTVAKKTVSAQSKINAAQLLKQIESLPPGSASNADMAAAKSSFPGYGDAGNLERWVSDTKLTLNNSLERQAEQYGFKQRVTVKQDYSADYAKYKAKYGATAKYKTYEEYAAARSGR